MATTILYPICPVCGQNVRSLEWLKTIGQRPVSIACESTFARRSIERRDLRLGEVASSDAVQVVGADLDGKPVFAAAGGRTAPDGWAVRLKRALVRAASTLGFEIVDPDGESEDAALGLSDPELTPEEFAAEAREYLAEAEAAVESARLELELRRKEVIEIGKGRE